MRTLPIRSVSRAVLAQCKPFAQLTRDLADLVFQSMEERVYDQGEVLIRQGDSGEFLLVILEGTAVAHLRRSDGSMRRIASFDPADVVGEMALAVQQPRTADVVAESGPVRALALRADAFQRLAARHPELGMVLTHVVAERLGEQRLDGMGDKVVDKYRIVRCVGRGAMAVVYEAKRVDRDDVVALKMMSHRLIYEPGAMARFQREADILQSLRRKGADPRGHPNVACIYDRFTAYKSSFIAMEFCDGPSLARLLARHGGFDEPVARRIVGQLAAALDYLHDRNVIHRDVKPGNIMFNREGVLKLTDFGLAKPTRTVPHQALTESDILLGTPLYMAPEQINGEEFGSAADVYALGVVAFEVLAGRPLFTAANFVKLIQEKAGFALPAAPAIGRGVSGEMHALLSRCLACDPQDRDVDLAAVARWAAPLDPALMAWALTDRPDAP